MKFFVAADNLKTFKLLNKNTISPKRIMVLCCVVNFKQFLHIDVMLSSNILCSSHNISHFQLFRKESVVIPIKHAKFTLFFLSFVVLVRSCMFKRSENIIKQLHL